MMQKQGCYNLGLILALNSSFSIGQQLNLIFGVNTAPTCLSLCIEYLRSKQAFPASVMAFLGLQPLVSQLSQPVSKASSNRVLTLLQCTLSSLGDPNFLIFLLCFSNMSIPKAIHLTSTSIFQATVSPYLALDSSFSPRPTT